MIKFILNNETISTDLAPSTIMADFLRYHQSMTGTKLGCREGDCGACTVLVGELVGDKMVYKSMTSCLMPLGNVQGKHLVSIEGLNLNNKALNTAQQAMVDTGGTQCGICTVGFVVSLCGFALNAAQHRSYRDAIAAIDGNICRCTGYKSIERAAQIVTDKLANIEVARPIAWLVEQRFIPAYFADIKGRMIGLKANSNGQQIQQGSTSYFVGGGTDLYVQKPEEMQRSRIVRLLDRKDLKGIWVDTGRCHIGASATTEDLRHSTLIQKLIPDIYNHVKLVSSTQIRNMGTFGGNLVNASPIGDPAIMLLALGCNIVLNGDGHLREFPLDQFFKNYKVTDRQPNEFVQELNFPLPKGKMLFNFEKVSKRTHLDIATVNTAMGLEIDENQSILRASVSAGGVAPVPLYLKKMSAYLQGKTLSVELLQNSIAIGLSEVAPISDVRGSKEYKRLLLRQLLAAHYVCLFPNLVKLNDLIEMPV